LEQGYKQFLQQQHNRQGCAHASQWLLSQAQEHMQQGQVVLPKQNLCALANALSQF
jgi:hypothetical protein